VISITCLKRSALTLAEIDQIPQITNWQRTMLYAMRKYGMYFDDTGTFGSFALRIGSGNQYTSIGSSDEWYSWGSSNWERYCPTPPYDCTQPPVDYIGKWDNALQALANHLFVLQSCVAEGICSGQMVDQSPVTN
jgi:hypothetical protein